MVTRVLLKLSQKIMVCNRKLRSVCDKISLLELYFHPARTKAWPKGKAKLSRELQKELMSLIPSLSEEKRITEAWTIDESPKALIIIKASCHNPLLYHKKTEALYIPFKSVHRVGDCTAPPPRQHGLQLNEDVVEKKRAQIVNVKNINNDVSNRRGECTMASIENTDDRILMAIVS